MNTVDVVLDKDGVALAAPEVHAPDGSQGLAGAGGVDERAVVVAHLAAVLMTISVTFKNPQQLVRMANQLLEEAGNPQHLLDVREAMCRPGYTERAGDWV